MLKPYRNKRTVELLWHGIWTYVLHHRIDVMIGCASLEGTDPSQLALPLSFLHHFAARRERLARRALPARHVAMDLLAKEAVDAKAALRALPPLIKGYLRLGASFGDGAVIDRQFGTTDVLVMLPVSAIDPRYIDHFGVGREPSRAAERFTRREERVQPLAIGRVAQGDAELLPDQAVRDTLVLAVEALAPSGSSSPGRTGFPAAARCPARSRRIGDDVLRRGRLVVGDVVDRAGAAFDRGHQHARRCRRHGCG